jgi:lipopolysaccharide export system protein LptA
LSSLLAALCLSLFLDTGIFTTTANRAVTRDADTEELVIDLIGDVVVTDGEVTVTSDSGTVWQGSGNAEFFSNVTIEADSLTGSSDYLEYIREAGMITLSGSVVLTDGETLLEAREVVYFRESGKATARQNVVMTGPDIGRVEGQYALYDRDRGSLFITVDPVLVRVEDGDSLIVIADRLEFFPDDNSAEAQGNASVSMPVMELYSTSEYLRYYGNEDRFELFGSPVLESKDAEMSGDWMEILLESSGDPRSVRIEGDASGHFMDNGVDPPAEAWFTSQRAFFTFLNSEPDSVLLAGSATLQMKSGGDAASRNEMNTVRGNTLRIIFENGEAVEVIVSGSVRGTYSYLGGN